APRKRAARNSRPPGGSAPCRAERRDCASAAPSRNGWAASAGQGDRARTVWTFGSCFLSGGNDRWGRVVHCGRECNGRRYSKHEDVGGAGFPAICARKPARAGFHVGGFVRN